MPLLHTHYTVEMLRFKELPYQVSFFRRVSLLKFYSTQVLLLIVKHSLFNMCQQSLQCGQGMYLHVQMCKQLKHLSATHKKTPKHKTIMCYKKQIVTGL